MEEWRKPLIYIAVGLALTICIMIVSYFLARRKGRDTVGWFLAPFFFAINVWIVMTLLAFCFPNTIGWSFIGLSGVIITILTPLILGVLPAIETQGFTKRCSGCGRVILWNTTTCRRCGRELAVPKSDPNAKVKRPLRACFLYESLFILLVGIIFGFVGYFCVPNQPRIH